MKKYVISDYVKKVFETPFDRSFWFGYYTYDPLNASTDKMLCNLINFDGREVFKDDSIKLGYFDVHDGTWTSFDETNSFNWQQGAMLQWVPNHNDCVMYNFSKDNSFKSTIYNLKTKEKKVYNYPIYFIHPSGEMALCLNYERSYWCRAYHYQSVINEKYNVKIAEDDGIFQLDFKSGNIKRLISIKDIVNLNYEVEFDQASHWLEHIMINKEGTKGVVLHRYSTRDVMNYKTRIIAFDIDGSNLVTTNEDFNMQWSHIGWISENEFVAYSISPSPKNNVNNKIIKKGTKIYSFARKLYYGFIRYFLTKNARRKYQASGCYRIYKIDQNKISEVKKLDNIGEIDGHPSITANRLYMITDTYPDSKGLQHLYIYSLKSCKKVHLGSFYAFYRNNPASCDLHPKLSRDDKYVMVDTAYNNKHHMILFEINWDKVTNELG